MKLCLLGLIWVVGCSINEGHDRTPPRFQLLDAAQTGVDFNNTIITTDSLNFQRDAYVYNGAGVGVGDINNDGLPDIFFAGNTVSSRLYLNKGGMRFTDITAKAGVATDRWATGVAMVDINNDGYLDIYVSVSGPPSTPASKRANLLFINNRNGTFTESAAKYGIADTGFTTQAAFFDYNRDNCLDLFVLNASPKGFNRIEAPENSGGKAGTIGSYNTLYRNNCDGTFTDVSREAGILRDAGFGLGVAIADLNQDGWPDIYVSNDIAPNDVVYMNNGDGTFTNKRSSWFKHTSYSGMGVDVADVNNDGWPDVFQVDMLPRDLGQRKRTTGSTTLAAQMEARRLGYLDDYTANTLQLNNGATRGGDPVFSDIARLAGIAATDWSWAPLIADFDNDGNKDIFVSNGYPKAVNDRDYVLPPLSASQPFGARVQRNPREMLNALYGYHLPNYVFRNLGDLTFRNETETWGMNQPSFSYGAAYADLDNDGRLDVVVNNMNAPAFIYHNVGSTDGAHYLAVKLEGDPPNRNGIGSQLMLSVGGKHQYLYQSPYRGYMSTVDMRPHFGLGAATQIDTLEVEWPDGRRQVLTKLQADRLIILRQGDATPGTPAPLVSPSPQQRFATITLPGLPHADSAPPPSDFMVQPMLPYAVSQHGPPIAVADVNGDGLDDIFIGANRPGVGGKLFLQQPNGAFLESKGQPWEADKSYEDWGAVFFDANGDGRPDLYVASGGYGLAPSSSLLQDRLYINVGKGRFARDEKALPPLLASKSVVRVGDFNGDGRPDLFVGGRLTPRSYPYPTRSFILRNDGGRFTDVTKEVAPDLIEPGGMITDAAWIDFDGDGRLDLVTTGEWMPVNFYHNDGSRLRNTTSSTGYSLRGWWYSLAVGDFDHDGRVDVVAGNLGLNYSYTTARDSAFGVYAGDFTGDRKTNIILTKSINGVEYPFEGLAPLGWQMYPLAIQFPTYGSFATAPMTAVLGDKERQHALHYKTDTFESVFLHNDGNGRFSAHALPKLAQISPIRAMIALDVDGDGNLDLVVTGNLSDAEPNTAPADAGNGLWLKGDGKGHFFPVPLGESGFLTPLAASGMALLHTAKGRVLLVTNVNGSLRGFKIRGQ